MKSPVLHGDLADTLLVSATVADDEDSVGLFLVSTTASGIERQDYRTFDHLSGTHVTLTQTPATRLGSGDATAAIAAAVIAGQLAV